MPAPTLPLEWELPRLRGSLNFEDDRRYAGSVGPDTEFFDVKFYPYSAPGSSPVFAAVSKRHIFVCRLAPAPGAAAAAAATATATAEPAGGPAVGGTAAAPAADAAAAPPCEILQLILDDDDDALNCSCTWTKDPVTEQALLCVAGHDAKVKVYAVGRGDGRPVRSFVGHGGEINDLATSPADPHLVASASDDTTVRLWSLDPVHADQPCVCLLGGEGHSWSLLSVAFHDSGRYVLSAGHDQVINLWCLPPLPNDRPLEVPRVVHYPHFSSAEIHTGLIDCVAFFGDLVLSRACHEDVIVLWRIEGFDSAEPPPSPEQAPSTQDTTKLTRSAFSTATTATAATTATTAAPPPQYTRLLQLHTPGCGPQFFMRFGLYNAVGHHPTLAFCNAAAKIFFWDFACFGAYRDFVASATAAKRLGGGLVPRPPWLRTVAPRKRQAGGGGGTIVHGGGAHHPGNGHTNNTNNTNAATNNGIGGRRLRELREANGLVMSAFGLRALLADRGGGAQASRTETGSDEGDSSAPAQTPPVADAALTPTTTTTTATTHEPPSVTSAPATPLLTAAGGSGGGGGGGGGGGAALRPGLADLYNAETLEDWTSKYSADDPHAQIKAHRVETVRGMPTVGRQVAWSPEGDWCVVVGSNSRIMLLQRWAKGEEGV